MPLQEGDLMYQKKLEDQYRCPLEFVLELFSGKWNSRVFCLLYQEGSMRYTDFRSKLVGISDPVLASTLKFLIKNGVIERTAYDEMPMRVEYSLTEKGMTAVPVLKEMCKWSINHHGAERTEATFPQCDFCEYFD